MKGAVLFVCDKRMTTASGWYRRFSEAVPQLPTSTSNGFVDNCNSDEEVSALLEFIRLDVIGRDVEFKGPFGKRKGNARLSHI